MGSLTTHVLDTVHGRPAEGVKIEFYGANGVRKLIKVLTTNAQGRCNTPLLTSDEFELGVFELLFHVGDYFRSLGTTQAEPAFLEVIPVRIGIGIDELHHVPLLISPWSYSVYRGC